MKIFVVVSILLMSVIIITSITISVQKQFLQIKTERINKDIYNNYGILQDLKAQWNYLNNSEYLKSLGSKYTPYLKPYNVKNIDSGKIYSLLPKSAVVDE